jgi:predicted permease
MLDTLTHDLRYAFRSLRRDAGFTLFAILILGLGIGATTTVFSVVNTLLLRPLPFHDATRLVWIANTSDDQVTEWTLQVGHVLDLREQSKSFADLADYFAFSKAGDQKLTGDGEPERLSGIGVSQNFFSLLGVRPILGRDFSPEECKWKGPGAVILSYGLWKHRYASDPAIVGHQITINEGSATIVGVMPATFDFASVFAPGSRVDLFLPMPLTHETNQWGNTLAVIGRLNPGATIEAARSEFALLADRIQKQHPERNSLRPKLLPLEDHVNGRLRIAVFVLACAVGLVMLVVCANIVNLQLARAAARQHENAVRVALGAGRARLIAQTLTESMVLTACGALLGLLLAVAGTRLLAGLQSLAIPLLSNFRTDSATLLFTLLLAVATGLVCGIAPALRVPVANPHATLQDGGRGSGSARRNSWIHSSLVVSEIALACVLLVGSGLLIKSFVRLLDVNLGFQPERAAAVRVDPTSKYSTLEQRNTYFSETLRRVESVPGISSAGLIDVLPLADDRSWDVSAKGKIFAPGHYPEGFIRVVSEGYLESMGVPLRAGRDFTERDSPGSEPVALVNETLAKTLWPDENPLGQTVLGEGRNGPGRTVVGVVADVRHRSPDQPSGCELYFPIRQTRDYGAVYLIIRTTLQPASMASSVRSALKPITPDLPGNDFLPVQQLVEKAVSPRRFVTFLLGGFAAFALILAALGIYAVISYSVSQRTKEIGICMALGATASRIQSDIVAKTLRLALIGAAAGAIASFATAQWIASLLYGTTPTDPAIFTAVVLLLCAVALLAGYLPARRASRLDPMAALRST